MKSITTSKVFLTVYVMISIATLYHSSFGFGTIDGLPNGLSGVQLFKWWLLGLLCATSVDVGMGAIVWSMIKGYNSKFLMISLLILAVFSAYSQLIYASYFAVDMVTKTKNEDLQPFMQFILDIRIVVLPLCLPFFSLFYGFVAKDSNMITGSVEEEPVAKRIRIVHYTELGSDKTACGLYSQKELSTDDKAVTCKNCINAYFKNKKYVP